MLIRVLVASLLPAGLVISLAAHAADPAGAGYVLLRELLVSTRARGGRR